MGGHILLKILNKQADASTICLLSLPDYCLSASGIFEIGRGGVRIWGKPHIFSLITAIPR
jgi:hypothetical protein